MKVLKAKRKFQLGVNGKNIRVPKNSVYILPDQVVANLYKNNPNVFNKAQIVNDILEMFEYFDAKKDTNKKTIFIRSGGIGDLVALSSLCKRVYEITGKKITFITQDKYFSIYDTIIPDYVKPAKFLENLKLNPKNLHMYKVVYFEGVIENSKDNWYELMFNKINDEFKEEYGRPQLDIEKAQKKLRKSKYLETGKFNVLFNPKSTSIIRSMPLEDMYNAALKVFNLSDTEFFVHEVNLKEPDKKFIKEKSPKIKVISKKECPSLEHYISDVYHVDYLISIDSAAVHIREGLEKPGLGIYASFPTDARTKYYKFMTTIDLPKKCELQPCFIHTKKPLQTCNIAEELYRQGKYSKEYKEAYSPCHSSCFNPNIIDFISSSIESALSKV